MRLGIFAKTFPGTDPATVLRAARDAGFGSVQYNLACSGLDSAPLDVPAGVSRAVRDAAGTEGIAIAALSGTVNLIHPDPATRADGLARLRAVIAAAPAMGAGIVTLCTGTRDPADPWRHHPDNARPDAWADLLDAMRQACGWADAAGVRLGIEPEPGNVVTDAHAARGLLDELDHPAPGIVLDPANLIEGAADPGRVVAEAIDLLADRLILAHAKDRAADGRVVPAGQGVVDWPDLVRRLRAAGFDGDLIAHGIDAAEAPGVAGFLARVTA